MEADRNYFSEVGKYIRENNISYHNAIELVEKYFRDNEFNTNEKSLVVKHIEAQIDLELTVPTVMCESRNDGAFDPTFDYHTHSLELLMEKDTCIKNLSEKVSKVFNDNGFSHNQRLFYRHILMFQFHLKIFEGSLKSSID